MYELYDELTYDEPTGITKFTGINQLTRKNNFQR